MHLEGRHAGVLADRAFLVDGEVDVLRDDVQRLRPTRALGFGLHGVLHGRTDIGRKVGRGTHDQLEDTVEE